MLLLLLSLIIKRRFTAILCLVATIVVPAGVSAGIQDDDIRNPFLRKAPGADALPPSVSLQTASADAMAAGGTVASHTTVPPAVQTLDPNERDPLLRVAIGEIYVIGTVTSPHLNIAYVRTRDGYKAPVHTGDPAGIEGFTVSMISTEGISLRKGEKIIKIPVHNPVIADVYVDESR